MCDFIHEAPETTNCQIPQTLRSITNDFSQISSLKIANLPFKFTDCFKEIITSNGVCYTYNMLHHKDLYKKAMVKDLRYPKHEDRSNWTIFGYKTIDPAAYPNRVLGSGQETELKITLRMKKKNIDYTCKSSADSFRLTLHTPDEIPQTRSFFHRIPLNVETLISLEPKVMTTADELKVYVPKKRQCYFPGEKSLKFFEKYSQKNCKLECLAGESCFEFFFVDDNFLI